MKILSTLLSIIALGLIALNISKINFDNPLQEDSTVALIGVVSGLIAIVILLLFNLSKSIEKKSKQ